MEGSVILQQEVASHWVAWVVGGYFCVAWFLLARQVMNAEKVTPELLGESTISSMYWGWWIVLWLAQYTVAFGALAFAWPAILVGWMLRRRA